MRPLRRGVALAALMILGSACDGSTPPSQPCDQDISNCVDDTTTFMEDEDCELEGELELVLGQGEIEFSPLAPGELPYIETGLQGGQHVWMAVQVHNPDLERRQLEIRVNLDYCDGDCEDPANWATDNVRELVADESTMVETPEGWLEQTRMLVTIFGWVETQDRRIEMLVTDPCGRQGYVVHEIPG